MFAVFDAARPTPSFPLACEVRRQLLASRDRAVGDTDGNRRDGRCARGGRRSWTPPYADYTSGHACVTGAATGILEHLFGTTLEAGLEVPSLV